MNNKKSFRWVTWIVALVVGGVLLRMKITEMDEKRAAETREAAFARSSQRKFPSLNMTPDPDRIKEGVSRMPQTGRDGTPPSATLNLPGMDKRPLPAGTPAQPADGVGRENRE
jgi:hypothetical protein